MQRRTMEGKTVLCASVTGTVTPRDGKDSEVSCLYLLNLATSSHTTKRENGDKLLHLANSNGETYRYNELFK